MTDNGLAALAAALAPLLPQHQEGSGGYPHQSSHRTWTVYDFMAPEALAAAILAGGAVFLPDGKCGHSLTAIEDLMTEIEQRDATIATLRAELEAWRHPDVAPSTPLALELATLRAIEKAARAACDNAYRDRADPETMDALRAALGED
jgi:hypothetical protein